MEYLARLVWDSPENRVHYSLLFEKSAEFFKDRPLTIYDKERIDYEVRTALFLHRDAEGNYSFIHRSFLEFFITRTIRAGIEAGDSSCLALKRITREVAFFLEFWPEALRGAILRNADLSFARLSQADLSEADLEGIEAVGARLLAIRSPLGLGVADVALDLRIQMGHSSGIRSVDWSPDGRCVASGSNDGTIKIWDAVRGRVLNTLEGHENWVQSVAWSPDGQRLASGTNDNTVRIWDEFRGRFLRSSKSPSGSPAWIGLGTASVSSSPPPEE